MARRRSQRGNSPVEEAINSAVDYGISAIIKSRPRFRGFKGVLSKYIDMKRVTNRVSDVYLHLEGSGRAKNGVLSQEGIDYLQENIANYVASGEAFDEAGKKIVLKRGLEEKARQEGILNLFSRRRAKEELKGINSLDRSLGFYGKVHRAFEEGGGYGMAELQKPLEYLSRAGFLHAALELSKEEGEISDREYRRISKNVAEGVGKSRGEYLGGLEKYSQYAPEKIAAGILAILGAGIFIASGAEITGNAVGGAGGNISGIFLGILLLFVSSVLFLRSFKN